MWLFLAASCAQRSWDDFRTVVFSQSVCSDSLTFSHKRLWSIWRSKDVTATSVQKVVQGTGWVCREGSECWRVAEAVSATLINASRPAGSLSFQFVLRWSVTSEKWLPLAVRSGDAAFTSYENDNQTNQTVIHISESRGQQLLVYLFTFNTQWLCEIFHSKSNTIMSMMKQTCSKAPSCRSVQELGSEMMKSISLYLKRKHFLQ